jgi:hypothetical protein
MTIDEHKALYNSHDASSDTVEEKAIKPITLRDFVRTLPGAFFDCESQK